MDSRDYPHSETTKRVIGAAIEVHRALGPGLLESAYEECLADELRERSIRYERQQYLPLIYKGRRLAASYRLDLLVEDRVIVEVKSVESISTMHEAQLLTYLRLAGKRVGLILNFNVAQMRDGIMRRVV